MSDKKAQAIVIHKDGAWYVKYPIGGDVPAYGKWNDQWRLNGSDTAPEILPDQRWLRMSEQPTTFQQWDTERPSVIKYVLKPEHAGLNMPAERPPEFFEHDGVYDMRQNAEFYGFYGPVRDVLKDFDVQVIVADLDCEPCNMRLPVKVSFPAFVAEYPECHHKYACTIGSDALFDELWGRVAEVVDASQTLQRDDYKSIRTLTVEKRFGIPFEKTVRVDRGRGRRKKMVDVPVRKEWRTVFRCHAVSYRNGSGSEIIAITGDTYADLEAKVEAFVQGYLDMLDDDFLQLCSCCKGTGVVRGADAGTGKEADG